MRDVLLQIRVSDKERALFKQAADVLGVTVSELVRGRMVEFSRSVILAADGQIDTDTVMTLEANRTSQLVMSVRE
jgi:uncharacterized protein (DUF1778 family)